MSCEYLTLFGDKIIVPGRGKKLLQSGVAFTIFHLKVWQTQFKVAQRQIFQSWAIFFQSRALMRDKLLLEKEAVSSNCGVSLRYLVFHDQFVRELGYTNNL